MLKILKSIGCFLTTALAVVVIIALSIAYVIVHCILMFIALIYNNTFESILIVTIITEVFMLAVT